MRGGDEPDVSRGPHSVTCGTAGQLVDSSLGHPDISWFEHYFVRPCVLASERKMVLLDGNHG
jgi:hypothetical protein